VDFLLPIYCIESNGQFVLFELDEKTKRILTTGMADMENRSIVMRTFKGKIANLINSVPY
jgi:hypothetical protein